MIKWCGDASRPKICCLLLQRFLGSALGWKRGIYSSKNSFHNEYFSKFIEIDHGIWKAESDKAEVALCIWLRLVQKALAWYLVTGNGVSKIHKCYLRPWNLCNANFKKSQKSVCLTNLEFEVNITINIFFNRYSKLITYKSYFS